MNQQEWGTETRTSSRFSQYNAPLHSNTDRGVRFASNTNLREKSHSLYLRHKRGRQLTVPSSADKETLVSISMRLQSNDASEFTRALLEFDAFLDHSRFLASNQVIQHGFIPFLMSSFSNSTLFPYRVCRTF